MFDIVTPAEMRRAEQVAENAGTTPFELMQRAGTAVALAIAKNFDPCCVLVMCGAGNNGGDGFIIAAKLATAGFQARVACTAKKKDLSGAAAEAAAQWQGEIEALNSNLAIKDVKLAVDAVFGTGFKGALEPEVQTLFDKIRTRKIPAVAVDVPSGVNAGTAAAAPGTLAAEMTVTFGRKKIAHLLQPARELCGKTIVTDIGIDDAAFALSGCAVFENDPALWLKDFPLPGHTAHKYSRGSMIVVAGEKRTGAACLAAHAGQRAGAGVVTLAAPDEAAAAVCRHFRASIMTDLCSTTEDLKTIMRDERVSAFIIGPGGGAQTREAVMAALAFNRPAVLDGEVFSAFAADPQTLFEKLKPHHILTPHEGEFARLFGQNDGNKLTRAREAAKKSGATVLLKGAQTVIAAPDGTAIIHAASPSTLATAGSGDVLAGIIGGLAAQGMRPFMAAAAGVWLHAQAARIHGLGLTSEDIICKLSQALNRLFDLEKTDS